MGRRLQQHVRPCAPSLPEHSHERYQVALGKCVNLSDPAHQEQCNHDAAIALAEARQTCDERSMPGRRMRKLAKPL